MNRDSRDRSSLAIGLDWAARITSIGLEFVVPALIGVGIDRALGTRPIAAIAGVVLGFALGIYHLLRIASQGSDDRGPRRPSTRS